MNRLRKRITAFICAACMAATSTAVLHFSILPAAAEEFSVTEKFDSETWEETWNIGYGKWEVKNGILECASPDSQSAAINYKGTTMSDFHAEFDVKIPEESANDAKAGMIFRMKSEKQKYSQSGYWIYFAADGRLCVRHAQIGVIGEVKTEKEPGEWVHISADFSGNQITVSYNETSLPAIIVENADFVEGYFSIASANCAAQFDNITVSGSGQTVQDQSQYEEVTVEYKNDFSANDMNDFQVNVGQWSMANGVLEETSAADNTSNVHLKDYALSDAVIEFKMKIPNVETEDNKGAFLVRQTGQTDSFTTSGYAITVNGLKNVSIRHATKGQLAVGKVDIDLNDWFTVKIVCEGDTISVYINDSSSPAVTTTDSTYQGSYVAFAALRTKVQFDDFSLRGTALQLKDEEKRNEAQRESMRGTIAVSKSPFTGYGTLRDKRKLVLNGQFQSYCKDMMVFEDVSYVPLRSFLDAIGASVDIMSDGETIKVVSGEDTYSFTLDEYIAKKNDMPIALDYPLKNVSNVVMFPIRGAELFGFHVSWEEAANTITLTDGSHQSSYFDDFDTQSSGLYEQLSEQITEDEGNQVLTVENGATPVLGKGYWSDYKISGRMKFADKKVDSELPYTTFEVAARVKMRELGDGTQGTIPFCYNVESEQEGDFLSIGSALGQSAQLEEGEWYPFTVEINKGQYCFQIGEFESYYYYDVIGTGGFRFRASNCKVYLDDIAVELPDSNYYNHSPVISLSLAAEKRDFPVYDTFKMRDLTAVKAIKGDGTEEYVTGESGLKWSVEEGVDKIKLFEGDAAYLSESAKEGDEIVLRASYGAVSSLFTLHVTGTGEDEVTYTKRTVPRRQKAMFHLLRRSFENGLDYSPSAYPSTEQTFRSVLAKMLMDPNEMDYSSYMNWMVSIAKWNTGSEEAGMSNADFLISQMLILYKTTYGKLNTTDEAWENMISYLQKADYVGPEARVSENHLMHHWGAAVIVCETWPDAVMFNGKTGRENLQYYKELLKSYITRRLKYGWGEYDGYYAGVSMSALALMCDYIQDEEICTLARGALEVLLADCSMDALDGFTVGARGRVYGNVLLEGPVNYTQFMLANRSVSNVRENYASMGHIPVLLMHTDYRPTDVLMNILLDREKRYVNRERKQLYTLPDDEKITGSLKKYSYVSPEYVLGAVNQYDRVGIEELYQHTGTWEPRGTWVPQGHQEMAWSLYFGKTRSGILFDGHPKGSENDTSSIHNYWTGDAACMDYRYFQNENVMIGLHKITRENELQFTHLYLPKSNFDAVEEEDGWIFVKEGEVYAAIRLLKDGKVADSAQYIWSTEGNYANIEAKVESADTAVICEVVDTQQYTSGYEQFKQDIKNNKIVYSIEEPYYIEYTGLNGKTLRLEYNTETSSIDGQVQNFEEYKLYDSPYMQSEWGSGNIKMMYGGQSVSIDLTGKMTFGN